MRRASSILFLLSACAGEPRAAVAPVIFGADDRIEVFAVSRPELRDLVVRAVPAMVHRGTLRTSGGIVTLASSPLGPSHGLCEGEAHFDQPSAASCSATLIDDDLVLTAGHCVDAIGCDDQRYVFGWYYEGPDVLHTIDLSEVYTCEDVVAYSPPTEDDFAIVRLDAAPPGPPAEVRLDPVVVGEVASLAGFPLGIPMKVVESGVVTGTTRGAAFFARLDAQPGNSGSGVFDADLRVIGELTNGPVDAFVDTGSCLRLRVIAEDASRTETIRSVAAAVGQLCASGYPSARLCGPICGDGTCEPGEACIEDCGPDAGSPDASAPPDAGPPPDAGRPPETDAGRRLRVPGGGGCTCRAPARAGDGHLGWTISAASGAAWLLRRRPRSLAR